MYLKYRSKQIKPLRAAAIVVTTLLLVVMLGSCTKELTGDELPSPDSESLEVCITFPESEQPQAANVVAKSNTFVAKAKASGDALSNVSSDASDDAEGLTFWTSDTPNAATRVTNAGTAEEQRINHMTIFVFNADGTTLESMLDIDLTSANTSLPDQQPQWKNNKTLMVRPITDKTSPKKIYAVANWNENNFDKATYTEAMLKDALSTITKVEQLATPLLMSGSKSVNLSTSDLKVTIELERQVAKLNINLTVDTEAQISLPNIQWLTDKAQIIVGNVPDKSYVVGRTTFPTDYTLLVSGLIPMKYAPASGDLKWNKSVYVHENPVTGADDTNKGKATWLVIKLPYRDLSTGIEQYDNYYQLYLDNKGDANPYQVLRNTIYNLNIRVMELGLPFIDLIPDVNIEEDLMVNPWEDPGLGDDTPKYFKITRSRIVFQMTETVQKVNISSDISDWKLIKNNGETIFSYAKNKTSPFTDANLTYTISGTASATTITITRNSTEPLTKQSAMLIARNIRVPFTVTEDNGIIPNSVLLKSFTAEGGVSYNGWPMDKLPPHGLQVARTGNKLPCETALSDDCVGYYSKGGGFKGGNYTVGTQERGCGFGKSNTDKLIENRTSDAVNLCVALGEEWYLPSINELLLICANQDLLGPSYSFTTYYYWSSTESANLVDDAMCTNFSNGYANRNVFKGSYQKVRCVRNI